VNGSESPVDHAQLCRLPEGVEEDSQERIAVFSVITPAAGYRTRESSRMPESGCSGAGADLRAAIGSGTGATDS
jgi:hypothetical protein